MYSDDDIEHCQSEQPVKDAKFKQHWERKERRRSSVYKESEEIGDNLGVKDNPKIQLILTKNSERDVLFADSVIKINRRGRTQERWLVITDGALYNIDPTSVKVRRRIPLANISHISTSLLQDNFFVIHVPLEYDYLYVSSRKTEIVSVLRLGYQKGTGEELTLAMQNIIDYRIDKDQQRRLVFQVGAEGGVYTKIYAKKTR